jgi:hypothetical protein
MIEEWLEIGNKNTWIKRAYDPPFNRESFYECKTADELVDKFQEGIGVKDKPFIIKTCALSNR